MTQKNRQLKEIIIKINDLIYPLGFKRLRHNWNRHRGNLVDVINVQKSQFDNIFTINIGLIDKTVHNIMWNERDREFFSHVEGPVYMRAGDLVSDYDVWWRIDGDSIIEPMTILESRIVPFFNEFHSINELWQYMDLNRLRIKYSPDAILNFSIISYMIGKKADYEEFIQFARNFKSDGWREKTPKIEAELRNL